MPGKPDKRSGFWLSLLMKEDHTWAGDKRLIPPGGKSAPSQEERTTGTPNCEARGGVTSNENASKLCYLIIHKGKIDCTLRFVRIGITNLSFMDYRIAQF